MDMQDENNMNPKLSVVIPVFNEEESIPHLCERLHEVLSSMSLKYEVIIVDDGSTDGSWQKLKEYASKYTYFRLIRFRRNFGQTAALSAGFDAARGEIIITMDADLQNDPADIPRLVAEIESGYDVVSGWRQKRKDPFITRRLPSIIANALISRVTGVKLRDFGCTLKAYRREILDDVRIYGEMHRFIPALAWWVGGKINEIPVVHHPRKFGKSKYNITRTIRVLLDLMTVSFLIRYSTRPLHIFGKIGLFFGIPGILILGGIILCHLSWQIFGTEFGKDLIKRPLWIIAPFMLILFCLQFIILGLITEMLVRTYHESQKRPIYFIRERIN